MTYTLFIDDIRNPVDETNIIARSSVEAIAIVSERGMPEFIHFDHDLGEDDTSIIFINWLTNQLIEDKLTIPNNFNYSIHSQNPVGAQNIKSKMDALIKHFKLL
jgi:hypothetical protein